MSVSTGTNSCKFNYNKPDNALQNEMIKVIHNKKNSTLCTSSWADKVKCTWIFWVKVIDKMAPENLTLFELMEHWD